MTDSTPPEDESPDAGPVLRRTLAPLWVIFAGGWMGFIDVTVELKFRERSLRFDLLDDFAGMLLVCWGVFRLAAIRVPGNAGRVLAFVKAVAVLAALEALLEHLDLEPLSALGLLWAAIGLVKAGAVVAFFAALRLFCAALECEGPAISWRTTMWNFVVLFAIPTTVFRVADALALMGITAGPLDLGPDGRPLLAAMVFPMIHFGFSILRVRRAVTED